jgi:CRP-like cAMP-binding protein
MFGELSLVYNVPRTASVIALDDDSVLFGLDKESFEKIIKKERQFKIVRYEKVLRMNKMLENMDMYERNRVYDGLKEEKCAQGKILIKKSEDFNKLYFVLEGQVVG